MLATIGVNKKPKVMSRTISLAINKNKDCTCGTKKAPQIRAHTHAESNQALPLTRISGQLDYRPEKSTAQAQACRMSEATRKNSLNHQQMQIPGTPQQKGGKQPQNQ